MERTWTTPIPSCQTCSKPAQNFCCKHLRKCSVFNDAIAVLRLVGTNWLWARDVLRYPSFTSAITVSECNRDLSPSGYSLLLGHESLAGLKQVRSKSALQPTLRE